LTQQLVLSGSFTPLTHALLVLAAVLLSAGLSVLSVRGLVLDVNALWDRLEADADTIREKTAQAERLAASAGAPQSEGWIAAQEALTAAIAARKRTATALGDIDGLAAAALQAQGGFAPNDLAAIKSAQAEVGALDARQSARIDAVQKRLGI